MPDVPHIIICLPKSQQKLGAQIAQGLTARGLHVSLVDNVAALQHLQPFAAICIGITRQKHLEEAVAAATTAQRPILPLLVHKGREMPPALRELQWSDFTRSFEFGWRELLLALDMEGLSHWPHDESKFDPDVVLARAQNGLTPPDWQVYRRFSRSKSSPTRYTFAASAGVLITSFLAFMIALSRGTGDESAVYLVFGVILAFGFYLGFQSRSWRVEKYGPLIVITPHGFLINEPTNLRTNRRLLSYSFATLQSIHVLDRDIPDFSLIENGTAVGPEDRRTRGSYLEIVRDDGTRKTVLIPAIFNFGPGDTFDRVTPEIAGRITVAFHHALKGGTSTQPSEHGSLIFLSYARTNADVVDLVEVALREMNLQPWVDRSQLMVGNRWREEIQTAIQCSSALVLFISPDSVHSPNVQFEVRTALHLGKPIIGFTVKTCRTIPADFDIRPYIRADMRKTISNGLMGKAFSRGFLQMVFALEAAGVIPGEDNQLYVLARGLMRMPLPGETVFYGGKMTRSDLLFMLFAGSLLATLGMLYQALMPVLYAVCIFGLIPYGLGRYEQAQAVPEMLVISPTGLTHNINGKSPTSIAFDELDDLAIQRSTWLWGTRVVGDIRQPKKRLSLRIPAHFRGHRQIAQRVIDAFQKSRK